MKYGIIQRAVSVDDVTLTTNGQGQIEVKGTYLDSYILNRVDDVTLRINAEDKIEIKPNNRNIQIVNIPNFVTNELTFQEVISLTVTKTGKYIIQLVSAYYASSSNGGQAELRHNSTVIHNIPTPNNSSSYGGTSNLSYAEVRTITAGDTITLWAKLNSGTAFLRVGGQRDGTSFILLQEVF